MTQKTINISINEIYSKGPKQNYITNKTDFCHIDDTWSLDILDLKDYGSENKRSYRYILVVIDNFSKIVWTVVLKDKKSQRITNSFENNVISSKQKPNLFKRDRGKEFISKTFIDFLNKSNFKRYSRHVLFGAVFAERFNSFIRDLLGKPVFPRNDETWVDVLPTTTKQYDKRIHSSSKLTPIQASLEKNEGFAYKNILYKRKKSKV